VDLLAVLEQFCFSSTPTVLRVIPGVSSEESHHWESAASLPAKASKGPFAILYVLLISDNN